MHKPRRRESPYSRQTGAGASSAKLPKMMSPAAAGKRLAKRSILGTRVAAPGEDGRFHPGIIQAVKTCEDRLHGENRYSVKFDVTRKTREFREADIIGPGFQSVTSSKLRAGQIVYVTHCNREMQGSVLHHRPNIDQVIIQLLVRRFCFFLLSTSNSFASEWEKNRCSSTVPFASAAARSIVAKSNEVIRARNGFLHSKWIWVAKRTVCTYVTACGREKSSRTTT